METKHNDIVAENQALKKQIRKLKRELSFAQATANIYESQLAEAKKETARCKFDLRIWKTFVSNHFPEWLDLYNSICKESIKPNKAVAGSGCKIISI
jgi:hypothetical protein